MEIFIVFIVSVFCCAFGTLVGGNSLITIPLLMLLGLPPHTAVGAHYSDRIGNHWIKRIFIGIVLVMAVKLLLAP